MIIGRTRYTTEKNLKENLLTKEKYYFISHLAREFIIKNSICSLPISLNDIVMKNNWKTIKYSHLRKLNDPEYNDAMEKNIGFTIFSIKGYFICYDETLSLERQRFTIAHEIGHIVLNHYHYPVENKEQEASMFAARILMPICILYECKVQSSKEISELCFVSSISASFRWERLEELIDRQKFYTDRNERKVLMLFQPFIDNYLQKKKRS